MKLISVERCYDYVSVSKLVLENVPVCHIGTAHGGVIRMALKQLAQDNYESPKDSARVQSQRTAYLIY